MIPNPSPTETAAPVPAFAPPGLEAAVDTLRFDPALHFQARLGAPGGLAVDSRSRAPLYMVHGQPLLARHLPSGWEGVLRSGELLFLPRGGRHELRTDPAAPVTGIDEMAARAQGNGRSFLLDHPAPVATLAGSFFWTRELLAQPLLARLPPVVHLRGDRCGSAQWLAPMGELMRWMTDPQQGGGVGMNESANALLRHVVLALVRHQVEAVDAADPLQHAGRDAGLGPALRAIHTAPEQDWSIERLATLCHMSRTAFAVRFNRALGESPLRYLTRWRMTRARQLMADRRMSLDQVAQRVGYSSGFALSKAYKRETKASPRGSVERRQAA
jgi:AraC-like DNA-binding protein